MKVFRRARINASYTAVGGVIMAKALLCFQTFCFIMLGMTRCRPSAYYTLYDLLMMLFISVP